MDIEEMKLQLQKFADAHELNLDIASILDNMSSGDFVEISQAMDNSDNITIMNVLQKYRARLHESYKRFNVLNINESNESINLVRNMDFNELLNNYRSFVKGATFDVSHLSLREMQTLVFEDMNSQLASQAIAGRNSTQNGSVDPTQQLKLNQTEIQQNAGNPSYKVTVPDEQGKSSIEQVIGVDIGQNPQQSLVVTKDNTNQNQVQVHSIADVQPVNEDGIDIDVDNPHEYQPKEVHVCDTEESNDEVLNDILSFCAKVQERK